MIINIVGIILIALIIWWFWLKKPKALKPSQDETEVIVENGVYNPSRIEVKKGKSVNLIFLRKDPSPCAEKVIFDDLDISLDLPVNKKVSVTLKIDETGEYTFNCQMKMYMGSIVVTE